VPQVRSRSPQIESSIERLLEAWTLVFISGFGMNQRNLDHLDWPDRLFGSNDLPGSGGKKEEKSPRKLNPCRAGSSKSWEVIGGEPLESTFTRRTPTRPSIGVNEEKNNSFLVTDTSSQPHASHRMERKDTREKLTQRNKGGDLSRRGKGSSPLQDGTKCTRDVIKEVRMKGRAKGGVVREAGGRLGCNCLWFAKKGQRKNLTSCQGWCEGPGGVRY